MPRFAMSVRQLLAATSFAALSISANAQAITHYEEPGLNRGRSYINDANTEIIDPFTGNLQLHYRDVVVPGNGGFDLVAQRSYNLLNIGESKSPFGRGWDIHFGRVKTLSGATSTA